MSEPDKSKDEKTPVNEKPFSTRVHWVAGLGVFSIAEYLHRHPRATAGVCITLAALIGVPAATIFLDPRRPEPSAVFLEQRRPKSAEIVDSGIYFDPTFTRDGEQIRFIHQTKHVPNRWGIGIGIKFVVTAPIAGGRADITIRILHPPFERPKQIQWSHSTVIGNQEFSGFMFSPDYERVPGTWTFQVIYEEEVLAEKSFQVIDAQ